MRWFESLLEAAPGAPLELRAHALRAWGGSANPAGRDDVAERVYAASLEAFRAVGDERNAAVLLLRLGYSAFYRTDIERARQLGEESLAAFSARGDRVHESQSLGLLGEVAYAEGAHDAGLELMAQSAVLAGETGFTWWRAGMLGKLADCERDQGLTDTAEAHTREAVSLSRDLGDRLRVVRGLARLARLAAERGDRRARVVCGVRSRRRKHELIGAWENERARFAHSLPSSSDEAFDQARERGRELGLDEAVDQALGLT